MPATLSSEKGFKRTWLVECMVRRGCRKSFGLMSLGRIVFDSVMSLAVWLCLHGWMNTLLFHCVCLCVCVCMCVCIVPPSSHCCFPPVSSLITLFPCAAFFHIFPCAAFIHTVSPLCRHYSHSSPVSSFFTLFPCVVLFLTVSLCRLFSHDFLVPSLHTATGGSHPLAGHAAQ